VENVVQIDTLGREVDRLRRRRSRISVGQRYGRWTVTARVVPPKGPTRWQCRCDCGTQREVGGSSLLSGRSGSCGCLHKQAVADVCAKRNTTHNRSGSPEYNTWILMKRRCFDKRIPKYQNYGGRGIAVCDEWVASFEAFLSHVGPRPSPDHSIDRIDNNGNYEPGNVRWATAAQQSRNMRTTTMLTVGGVTRPLVEWAELKNIKAITLHRRIHRGWSPERAVLTPVRRRG